MKLTKSKLKKIILEELQKILKEQDPPDNIPGIGHPHRDSDIGEIIKHYLATKGAPLKAPLSSPWAAAQPEGADSLDATLRPQAGDLVYPALGNLPASMYGPGGTGPEGQLPYGHYGTDPEQEWPRQWADPVPLIPGLTPEETAAYYGIDPVTGDPISHTPDVGRRSTFPFGD